MVTNPSQVDELIESFQRQENLSFEKKLALLDGMYLLAREFGHFHPDRALEGIEHDIHLASALNSIVRRTPQ